jgi:HAD superfamily hydrolase (TIGR01509 family)
MLKAILFDIDGVLVDTRQANIAFYQQLLSKFGYPPPTSEDVISHFHLTMWDSIKYYAHTNDSKIIDQFFDAGLKLEYPKHLMVVPVNSQSVLTDLSLKYKLGLVTGRVNRGVRDFLDVFGHQDLFSVKVTAEEYTHPKPHPDPLLLATKKLQIKPKEAIYIGDMPSDIEAAQQAKMKSVIFSQNHEPTGADYYFSEFNELPGIIDHL